MSNAVLDQKLNQRIPFLIQQLKKEKAPAKSFDSYLKISKLTIFKQNLK
jgi:hypothetical protein